MGQWINITQYNDIKKLYIGQCGSILHKPKILEYTRWDSRSIFHKPKILEYTRWDSRSILHKPKILSFQKKIYCPGKAGFPS